MQNIGAVFIIWCYLRSKFLNLKRIRWRNPLGDWKKMFLMQVPEVEFARRNCFSDCTTFFLSFPERSGRWQLFRTCARFRTTKGKLCPSTFIIRLIFSSSWKKKTVFISMYQWFVSICSLDSCFLPGQYSVNRSALSRILLSKIVIPLEALHILRHNKIVFGKKFRWIHPT